MAATSYASVIWPAFQALSAPLDLGGNATVVGFKTPSAGLTGTTFTFVMSETFNGTYATVKDSGGSAISFSVGTSGYYGLKSDQVYAMLGVRFLKISSNASESAGLVVKLAIREVA